MESDLPVELLKAWHGAEAVPYVPASHRSRALGRALEYMRSRLQSPITVEELCRHSAASISTLERAFRERFGVSPKQFLTAVRLGGVRRALLDPAEGRDIGDVAAYWGFWHPSKFSADYKRMFGELPSQTRS
jgi:AraC family ethanolamine operon transcriptional activator